MKVLIVADHDFSNYGRGQSLYEGLKANSVNVILYTPSSSLKYIKLCWRILKNDYDALITKGIIVWFLARLFCFKPIIHDCFISNYEALVESKKCVPKKSLRAKLLWFTDKIPCKFSSRTIIDTEEHGKYFSETFNIPTNKFTCVPLGADDTLFFPQERDQRGQKEKEKFRVLFHGSFIAGHGIQYILDAAKILKEKKDIEFRFVGTGPLLKPAQQLKEQNDLNNVVFEGPCTYQMIPQKIKNADVLLGQFDGAVAKMQRVVAFKVIEGLAMAKAVITGEAKACKEFLTDKKDIIFCNFSDGKELAEKIELLKENKPLLKTIERQARKTYNQQFHSKVLGAKVAELIHTITAK